MLPTALKAAVWTYLNTKLIFNTEVYKQGMFQMKHIYVVQKTFWIKDALP